MPNPRLLRRSNAPIRYVQGEWKFRKKSTEVKKSSKTEAEWKKKHATIGEREVFWFSGQAQDRARQLANLMRLGDSSRASDNDLLLPRCFLLCSFTTAWNAYTNAESI